MDTRIRVTSYEMVCQITGNALGKVELTSENEWVVTPYFPLPSPGYAVEDWTFQLQETADEYLQDYITQHLRYEVFSELRFVRTFCKGWEAGEFAELASHDMTQFLIAQGFTPVANADASSQVRIVLRDTQSHKQMESKKDTI